MYFIPYKYKERNYLMQFDMELYQNLLNLYTNIKILIKINLF